MHIINGHLVGQDEKIAIVASRFNELIVNKLIGGAEDALTRHGIASDQIDLFWVPGAFEIPSVAQRVALSDKYDAVICLGAVIRGATPHFDYVCAEVSKGIAALSMTAKCPVMFGVLTTDSIAQAIERAGSKAGNKGYDVAVGALEMMDLYKQI